MQISIFCLDCEKPYKIKKPIRLIELFGGIGSQAKALENLQANFTHYRLCEFDKYAVTSYNAVHGTNFKTSDITKIKAEDLGIIDTDKYDYILTYSFPCQDLSIAGKQAGMEKGSGTRSGLLWEVERLLKECKELPQVLLMENVPQVLNCDFVGWLEFLESKGYHNYYKCLNAKNFGIPQNRDRCFMVSVLGNYYYDFPKEIPLKLRLKDMLESKVDEKYYLSEKGIKYFEKQANNRNETLSNIKDLKIVNLGHGQSKGSIQKAELFPTLDTRTSTAWHSVLFEPKLEVVATLDIPGRFESACRVHGIDRIAPTCNTCGGGGLETKIAEPRIFDMYNHNEIKTGICGTLTTHGNTSSTHCGAFGVMENDYRIRKLTPKECWRLMGFSDKDFYAAQSAGISNSQLYKQAGNSIVVNVLEEIFKKLF